MTKKDVLVQVNAQTRKTFFTDNFLGLQAENLQGNLIFTFNDAFVNGTPRVEVGFKNGQKYVITELEKVNNTYIMPIKSSLLSSGDVELQLVIVETGGNYVPTTDTAIVSGKNYFEKVGDEYILVENPVVEDLPNYYELTDIPIFKSKRFSMVVLDSINAQVEIPQEYATLYNTLLEKIAESSNLNIDAERVEDGVEITITKKDGTTKEVKANDGQQGPKGSDAKINGVNTLNLLAGENINIEQDGSNLTISSSGGYDDTEVWNAIAEHDRDIQNIENDIDAIDQDIDNLGIGIDNLDINKVPTSRKINNKELTNDITLTPSDIGIGSVFTLKGSVATVELLPSSGNQIGDVYYVENEEVGYIWLEKLSVLQWEQLGLPIDLSNYYNKTQTDSLINGISPVIINATTNTTINGYQVPQLTTSQITQIYNGVVAGKEVVVSDATGNMHFKVNQADSVSGEVFISFLYYDIMLLEYDENATITYKEFATKTYVDNAIGNAIEGAY